MDSILALAAERSGQLLCRWAMIILPQDTAIVNRVWQTSFPEHTLGLMGDFQIRWFEHTERMNEYRSATGIFDEEVNCRIGQERPRNTWYGQGNQIL